MSSSKTPAPPDDALLTALAVEQIATQKRDQTTTQDVKRDVATRRETSKSNDKNADADVNSRQTSTSDRRDKRDSASRWKTAALAWFGSFAIFCAVATLTFALIRDASPTQTAATQTVAATVPASDVSQIAPPTPTQNVEPQTIAFEGSAFEAETPVNQTTQHEEPQAIAFEEPALDDKTSQTPLDATFVEESQVDQTTQSAEPQAIAFEEPALDDKTPLDATPAEEPQAVETTQALADAELAPSEAAIYRKKISDVKIGERAVGVNPQGATPGEDDAIFGRVKHCGYKLCYLKENGTTCEIELLRPVDWLDYERVQLRRKTDGKVLDELDFAVADILASGASVDFTPAYDVEIWVELPEMGVLGWATLEEIDDEIAIQPGPGAVVTGTFAHISDAVIDLQIEDQPKPIGCTTTHPFWSVDRQDFVEAGRLQQGERVQLYNGETKRVVQKLPRPGPVNVYNLEVYAEHVYSVTPDGVLAHNACKNHEHHIVMKGAFSHWKEENRIYVEIPQIIFEVYKIEINGDDNKILNIPNRGHSIEYAKTVCYHIFNAYLLGNGNEEQVKKYVSKELKNLRDAIIEKNDLAGVIDAKFVTYGDIQ